MELPSNSPDFAYGCGASIVVSGLGALFMASMLEDFASTFIISFILIFIFFWLISFLYGKAVND